MYSFLRSCEDKEDKEDEEDEEEVYAGEDEQLQLALALSLSSAEDERRGHLERQSNRKAPAARGSGDEEREEEGEDEAVAVQMAGAPPALRAAGSASSSNGNEDGLADEGGEAEEEEPCGGCCFAGLATFAGEPSDRPDSGEPQGGWGHTVCCWKPVHFYCLGKHLHPRDKLVDSTSGPVQMALGCPFCRKPLSRGSRRQLRAEGRCMRAVHIHMRTSNTYHKHRHVGGMP